MPVPPIPQVLAATVLCLTAFALFGVTIDLGDLPSLDTIGEHAPWREALAAAALLGMVLLALGVL